MVFNETSKEQSSGLTKVLDGVGAILAKLAGSRYLPAQQLLDLLRTLEHTFRTNLNYLAVENVRQITEQLKALKELVQEAKYKEYLAQVKLLNKAKDKLKRSHKSMDLQVRDQIIQFIFRKEKEIQQRELTMAHFT